MRVTGAGAGISLPEVSASEAALPTSGTNVGSGWGGVLENALSGVNRELRAGTAPELRVKQLADMIKLQMEVCRHQVQVELVSKVAESGVASVRKLQQPQ